MSFLLLLGWPLVGAIPLLVYLLLQTDRGRLLGTAGRGALVGLIPGLLALGLAVFVCVGGAEAGLYLLYLGVPLIAGTGSVVGAWWGAAVAEMSSAQPARARGARLGALYGGLPLAVLGLGLPAAVHLSGLQIWMGLGLLLIGPPVSALVGAQIGASREVETSPSAGRRWSSLAAALSLLVLASVPLMLQARAHHERRQQQARRAEERKYAPFRGDDPALKQLQSGTPQQKADAARQLGNPYSANDDRAIPALRKALKDQDAEARAAAAEALATMQASVAIPEIGKLVQEDPDPNVRRRALGALLNMRDYAISPYVRAAAADPDPTVAKIAKGVLGIGPVKVAPPPAPVSDPQVKAEIAQLLQEAAEAKKRGDKKRAEFCWVQVSCKDITNAEAQWGLAWLSIEAGRRQAAQGQLRAILQFSKDEHYRQRAQETLKRLEADEGG